MKFYEKNIKIIFLILPRKDDDNNIDKRKKFLEKHIVTTTNLQIDAIKLAISLIKNQEDWWKLWYMKCLKKSLLENHACLDRC